MTQAEEAINGVLWPLFLHAYDSEMEEGQNIEIVFVM
jgi:hypothetical protein